MAKRKSFTWSYSRLQDYELCPAKLKFHRDKAKAAPNKAMQRGIDIHKKGEDFLKGDVRQVPKEYNLLATELKEKRARGARPEGMYAFTRDWVPTGYWESDVWVRMKLDIIDFFEEDRLIEIIDIKSGQPRQYPDQDRLYKVAGLCLLPHARQARTFFWFVDHGLILPRKPTIAKRKTFLEGAQREFEVRAGRMEKETRFKATPGQQCKWCDFSKHKGGPCTASKFKGG